MRGYGYNERTESIGAASLPEGRRGFYRSIIGMASPPLIIWTMEL